MFEHVVLQKETGRDKKDNSYIFNDFIETYNIDSVNESHIAIEDSRGIELDSATCQMTLMLSKKAKQVVFVDGSKNFIRIAKERTHDTMTVTFQEVCYESTSLSETFDCLVILHVLKHIENPSELLN